jgi:WD40 repeat protein
VFKTSSKKELGALHRHTGAITGLAFFKTRNLFSCSSDGTICVWRVKDWECLLQIKAHKKGVRSLALHPSGRMALTLGEGSRKVSRSLLSSFDIAFVFVFSSFFFVFLCFVFFQALLWNLMTGKQAVVFKLDRGGDPAITVPSIKGEKVSSFWISIFLLLTKKKNRKAFFPRDFLDMPQVCKWSPSGNLFLIQWAAQLDVFSASGDCFVSFFFFLFVFIFCLYRVDQAAGKVFRF